MSKSTTSNKNVKSQPKEVVKEVPVRAVRDITRYTFEYQRDRVSRKAGASYFRVEGLDGESLDMTLQEAQSLYNFLGKALAR